MADKMGAALGQPVIVENVGGVGGSIGVVRLARATPDGYTHRHRPMGHPCRHHHLQYQLRSADRFHADRVDLDQSDVAGRQEDAAGRRSQIAGRLHEGASGDAKFVNQNASAQVGGLLLQKLTGTELLFVPYRGAGPAMTDLISGQVDLLLVQGAVALPQVRAGTI
jgi:tripartite-type tricarboxylate transporter receptor subunit TctC